MVSGGRPVALKADPDIATQSWSRSRASTESTSHGRHVNAGFQGRCVAHGVIQKFLEEAHFSRMKKHRIRDFRSANGSVVWAHGPESEGSIAFSGDGAQRDVTRNSPVLFVEVPQVAGLGWQKVCADCHSAQLVGLSGVVAESVGAAVGVKTMDRCRSRSSSAAATVV